MNKSEYLLTCIAEEAAEILYPIFKAQRFGLDHVHPDKPGALKNSEEIVKEFLHLQAVIEVAQKEKILPVFTTQELENIRRHKRGKLSLWKQFSKGRGCLNDRSDKKCRT